MHLPTHFTIRYNFKFNLTIHRNSPQLCEFSCFSVNHDTRKFHLDRDRHLVHVIEIDVLSGCGGSENTVQAI